MVLLTTTATIIAALNELSPSTRADLQLPEPSPATEAPISHEQLISLSKAFVVDTDVNDKTPNHKRKFTLNALLRGTNLYIPPAPPKPEPSPEYLARKARLQALADEQAYNALIAPSSSHTTFKPSPIFSSSSAAAAGGGVVDLIDAFDENDSDDMITPSLVLNIFMSVLLCGFATFWALKNFQTPSFLSRIFQRGAESGRAGINGTGTNGTETTLVSSASKDPVFVLISMFTGILVGVAETVVYAAYVRKVKLAKAAEKKLRERKEVVSSVQVTARPAHEIDNPEDDTVQEVKIWGKGVNGGVRRRIREKWESTVKTTVNNEEN